MTDRSRRARTWVAVVAFAAASCVTARADAPAGRFVASAGTVFDSVTGLLWQQQPSDPVDLFAATSQCQSLNLAGKTGWRLPTVHELHTIVDERRADPALDPTFSAPTSALQAEWSSTHYAASSGLFWTLDFSIGFAIVQATSDTNAVRCVR